MDPIEIPFIDVVADLEGLPAHLIACNNWPEYTSQIPYSYFKIGHNNDSLFLMFFTGGLKELRAQNTSDQSPVSEDSCVEAFIEPFEGGQYWNFELNCNGALNASHRLTRPEPQRLTADELIQIKRKVVIGEDGLSWTLTLEIPLKMLGLDNVESGHKLRANFYAVSAKADHPYYLSWVPIGGPKPNYHQPEFFMPLVLK